MPSPICHTLAGCAVALILIPPGLPQAWEAWTLCLISANLADFDFMPGLLAGRPRAFHRGPSHSLVVGLIAAGLGAFLWTWSPMSWLARTALIFLAYASHVVLDCYTPGRGILLGWPFSRRRYQVARPWLLSVTFGTTHQHLWVRGWRLLRAIGREVLFIAPVVAVLACARGLLGLPR
jgi:membrane-bound metal-dependent hydrolase YbcI (DUF457 family)